MKRNEPMDTHYPREGGADQVQPSLASLVSKPEPTASRLRHQVDIPWSTTLSLG